MIFVVSPHLDDAVLSLGQMMCHEARQYDVTVVTVFAGLPSVDVGLTPYDEAHRPAWAHTSRDVVAHRRTEDDNACAHLGLRNVRLDHLDGQYVNGRIRDEDKLITASIGNVLNTGTPDIVFSPLGLMHPDHELVAACARIAAHRLGHKQFVYEELPARVLRPDLVGEALARLHGDGYTATFHPPAADAQSLKARAIRCYESQGFDGDPCVLVPERAWALEATR